mgnify:CR=1 FL=1
MPIKYKNLRDGKVYTLKKIGIEFAKICHEDDPNIATPDELPVEELIQIGREIARCHEEYIFAKNE